MYTDSAKGFCEADFVSAYEGSKLRLLSGAKASFNGQLRQMETFGKGYKSVVYLTWSR